DAATFDAEPDATLDLTPFANVGRGGDVDGDGLSDVIAADPLDYSGLGRVWLFHGAPELTGTIASAETQVGPPSMLPELFGETATFVDDLNGDGYADLAVGARYSNQTGMHAGAAYVYFGGERAVLAKPVATLLGEAAADEFGASVASAKDVDQDGYGDIVVGAPRAA